MQPAAPCSSCETRQTNIVDRLQHVYVKGQHLRIDDAKLSQRNNINNLIFKMHAPYGTAHGLKHLVCKS